MKTPTCWNSSHCIPLYQTERAAAPYICRIAPSAAGFAFDFIDSEAKDASYRLIWRLRDGEEEHSVPLCGHSGSVDGLDDGTDYAFRVERSDGVSSTERLVHTGEVPGIIVNYLHPDDPEYEFSGRYLCSPSLLKLPDGSLLASMDLYAGGAPQNLTLIYVSHDGGITWSHLTELFPCFWGKLFLCSGKLYMLGCSTEYGDVLIGRSDDGGASWTAPTVLLRGFCHCKEVGWHRAPMPVLISNGRVMTDVQYGAWSQKVFCDAVLSAPSDSDLLDASNWVCTELWDARKHIDPLPERIWGGIEGNVIEAPDGGIVDLLRFSNKSALILRYDAKEPEKALTLDRVIDFPATASKFDVLYDSVSGKYLSIVSWALDEPRTVRNLLSFICSDDLIHWKLCRHLIDYRNDDPKKTGLQYVDFLIDGEDILYLTRTALNQPHSFHDSNYITFHSIENFRSLL